MFVEIGRRLFWGYPRPAPSRGIVQWSAMSERLAAITGASAGLGTVFARKLAAQGYDLLLIARRRDRLDQLAGELTRAHGIAAGVCAADLATQEGIDAVASRLASDADLNVLVNNAGFGTRGRFHQIDVAG